VSDELNLLDAYWRAANYLSVGHIYLLANPLLREPLRPEHVKPRLLGHWGTTPSRAKPGGCWPAPEPSSHGTAVRLYRDPDRAAGSDNPVRCRRSATERCEQPRIGRRNPVDPERTEPVDRAAFVDRPRVQQAIAGDDVP
jgi:XFP N-terminal domain